MTWAVEHILLIDPKPDTIQGWLTRWLSSYPAKLHVATNGLDGLRDAELLFPGLVLINCDLPDMSGMSVSTILKDSQNGPKMRTYLYNVGQIYENTKADYFCPKVEQETLSSMMKAQVLYYLNCKMQSAGHGAEIQRAKSLQYQELPKKIDVPGRFLVSSLFSAYNELSGDSYTYFLDEKGNLFGVLFDCTGHDILAFSQVKALRTLLLKDLRIYASGVLYTSLSEVLSSVNEDLFAVSINNMPEDMPAAIVFHLDYEHQVFHYAMAGMPGLLVRKVGEPFKVVEAESYLLGLDENATYQTDDLPLEGVTDIICCSDGLFELVYQKENVAESQIAKHDDVSAISITFSQPCKGEISS